jgi:aspartate carbamoyltransferase catalytic subunit
MTILERKGKLNGIRVAIVGDVEHSRVARSNVWLLHKMGAHVSVVGPRTLIPSHTGMLPAKVFYDLATGIEGADVIICLRLQRERMQSGLVSSVNSYRRQYQINAHSVRYASKDCLVMHPGPINRGIEVDDVVADGENSAISQQIENGIYVRMAALYWSFEGSKNKGVLA